MFNVFLSVTYITNKLIINPAGSINPEYIPTWDSITPKQTVTMIAPIQETNNEYDCFK